MKMKPNQKYKIEQLPPEVLEGLLDDFDQFLADSSQAGRLIRKMNDNAFDIRRKLIAIKNDKHI